MRVEKILIPPPPPPKPDYEIHIVLNEEEAKTLGLLMSVVIGGETEQVPLVINDGAVLVAKRVPVRQLSDKLWIALRNINIGLRT